MRGHVPIVVLVACLLVSACGGAPSGPSGSGGQNEPTFTITSTGISPSQLTVSPGGRVLFVNNDTRAHDMEWDPHPDHQGPCGVAGVNPPGFVAPGQTRESGNLVNVQSCGFHDHDNPPPGGSRWTGTILVR